MSKKASPEDRAMKAYADIAQFGSFTSGQMMMNVVASVLLAVIPAFLYHSIKDMPFEDNLPYYAASVAACVYFMNQSYHKSADYKYQQIHKKRKPDTSNINQEKLVANAYRREAAHFSLFFNNLLYFIAFSFLAFYAFRNIDVQYNFTGSVGVASLLVYLFNN